MAIEEEKRKAQQDALSSKEETDDSVDTTQGTYILILENIPLYDIWYETYCHSVLEWTKRM